MFELDNLRVERQQKVLLDAPQLLLKSGYITSIIGANGAGKSTLFRVLLAEIKPQRGSVLFKGLPLCSYSLQHLSLSRAYIAQSYRPVFNLTVIDYLQLARQARGETASTRKHWLLTIVAQLDICHLLDRNIVSLSGGEFQRIEFARACLQLIGDEGYQGKVILLDEPSSALDIKQTKRLYDHIQAFNAAGGTVLVIEHNINYAANFSDQMIVIKAGKIVASGDTQQVFNSEQINDCFDSQGVVTETKEKHYHYHILNS